MIAFLLAFQSFAGFSQESEGDDEKEKRVEFAIVPRPTYNTVQGFGLGILTGLFYQVSLKDTISFPSSSFVLPYYAENETWYIAGLQEFWLDRNNYHLDFLIAGGSFNFQVGLPKLPDYVPSTTGQFIPFSTGFVTLKTSAQRRVWDNIYVGLFYKLSSFQTDFSLPGPIDSTYSNESSLYSGLGLKLTYDARDYPLNPRKGWYLNVGTLHFRDFLASAVNFDKIEIEGMVYFPLAKRHTLTAKFTSEINFGDVPFEEQPIMGLVGSRAQDLRGYSKGANRGNQIYILQAEWRWNFFRRWGMVAFTGAGLVGDDGGEIESTGVLPSVGAGIRFLASEDKDVNIGLDGAVGKDDWGIYIQISESF